MNKAVIEQVIMTKVESVSLQRKEPERARCSRLFFAEHDLIDRKDGNLVASIYSTYQALEANFGFREQAGIQTFAILWGQNGFDSRLIRIVEKGIIESVLSPVQLIHHSNGLLTIILNPAFRRHPNDFVDAWQEIALNAAYDNLELRCMYEKDNRLYNDGRLLHDQVKSIIATEILDILDYRSAHSLFDNEWDESDFDGPEGEPDESGSKDGQSAFDFFDDDFPL
ncbi:hypothetical protein C1X59_08445 [Pseudomonas sp. FW215-R2]|jgi:hypothetical protein|nr:hypothetical protein C1X59_08445 [Pseudomonas sp. FW215-R2]PMX11026.1 hypothetical protein C1X60_07735 [Pseudomonas sp. FW215-L1]PMX20789.1 hypothetical protein C1X57_19825 [Pseudomonas sp. FW215-E1]PNA25456.1 hypothetical protein C1X58_22025 [Pseudomonas sp. FW215-R4]